MVSFTICAGKGVQHDLPDGRKDEQHGAMYERKEFGRGQTVDLRACDGEEEGGHY